MTSTFRDANRPERVFKEKTETSEFSRKKQRNLGMKQSTAFVELGAVQDDFGEQTLSPRWQAMG